MKGRTQIEGAWEQSVKVNSWTPCNDYSLLFW